MDRHPPKRSMQTFRAAFRAPTNAAIIISRFATVAFDTITR